MSKPKHTAETYRQLRSTINPDTGELYSNYEVGELLGVSEASVRRGLKGWKPEPSPGDLIDFVAKLDVPLRHDVATQGGIAITSDWHWPVTKTDLVEEFLEQAADMDIRNLAVIGDWFNLDSLSAFDSKQEAANLVRELEASTKAMERVASQFDRVYFTWGNHDARFHKVLAYRVQFKKAMRMLFEDLAPSVVDKITFSNLDHMWVDTPRGPWYFAHPRAYSSSPLTNARKLASKVLANVGTGHSHHTALGWDVSGKFICTEIGGFFDSTKTEYLQRTTTYANWQNGWGLLDEEGWFYLEGEGWTVGKRAA